MPDSFYVTTPIYYVNARPHLGHAYTTIVADVAKRFHQMLHVPTYFSTGTDEHGDKIMMAASAEGMTPKAYVDHISGLFRSLWPDLDIANDYFIRTTDADHMRLVSQILQRIYDAGDIYFSEYEGLYCFGCERFYTERELVDGKCPDHQQPPEIIREANYFFKMSRYQKWLIEHINNHPDFIRPERYRNEVLAFLREPLEDLCISRPKSRIQWGISLPFDDNYVTYVWFDALINYVTALGYPDDQRYRTFWPHAQHVVAKDILKPHGIYWPIMLKAAGIPIYQHLNVHGYWNVDETKMSKSLGNVIDPLKLKDVYGLEAFRFFLMRDMVFGLDSSFSESAFVQRINADLANDLGNLFSRVLTMARKYCGGVVPAPDPAADVAVQPDLACAAADAVAAFKRHMPLFAFHKALIAVWELIGHMNKYVDVTAPWELAKRDGARAALDTVIYNLLEGLRIVAGLIYPVMPQTAQRMQMHLGADVKDDFYHLERLAQWGQLPPGQVLRKSITLFPRVTVSKPASDSSTQKPGKAQVADASETPAIDIAQFQAMDLRVGQVVAAEKIKKSKKLLKLQVDIGEIRTIVSGISEHFKPEDLVGKQVVVIANLKPVKLMGIQSNGMILAASDADGLDLLTTARQVQPGTRVS